jgi:hypothetical protein
MRISSFSNDSKSGKSQKDKESKNALELERCLAKTIRLQDGEKIKVVEGANVFDNEQDAMAKAKEIACGKNLVEDFRVVEYKSNESAGINDVICVVNDIPIEFGEWKKYRDRQVKIINALAEPEMSAESSTSVEPATSV